MGKHEQKEFGFGTQIRKSPYFEATVRWGANGFSVYNHMYIPRDFGDPEQNFWNLVNDAILCDVAVERQVEITGPDAAQFAQLLRRIEGGMLSYHADMDSSTNPYELGLDRLVELDMEADFIGKAALKRIREKGVSRKHVALAMVSAEFADLGTTFDVDMPKGKTTATVVERPFFDPNKKIAVA